MLAPGPCQRGALITPGMLPTGPESKLVFPAFPVLSEEARLTCNLSVLSRQAMNFKQPVEVKPGHVRQPSHVYGPAETSGGLG